MVIFLFLLLILFIIFKYKKEKDKLKPTLFLICLFFTFGIIRPFLYLSGKEFNYDNLIGVVYKAENNYALIATLKGNYYIKESNLEVGDILSLLGKASLRFFLIMKIVLTSPHIFIIALLIIR